jgi:hypothetical protein
VTGSLIATSGLQVTANNNALGTNNTLRFTDTDTATEANQQIGKIEFFSSDTSTPGAGVKAYIGAFAADTTPDAYIAFATQDGSGTPDPVERLRISSEGNVGIGTTPISKFDINVGASGARRFLVNYDDNIITIKGANASGNGETLRIIADNIRFNTGTSGSGTEKMRLDLSGNLGLGVTPSAWSVIQAMQVLNTSWGASPNNLILYQSSNVFYDGAFKYITTGTASQYRMNDSGIFSWLQAPSGTAGGTITFTPSMTLDASGNLLIGPTSNISSTRRELVMTGANGSVISLGNNTTADRFQIVSDSGENALLNNKANTPMVLYTNNTERLRITSGGQILVNSSTDQTGIPNPSIQLTGKGTSPFDQPAYHSFAHHGNNPTYTNYLTFTKSRGTTENSKTAVASGDRLGMLRFNGADGTNYIAGTEIYVDVDGTVSTNVVPSRIVFSTMNTSGTAAERVRITAGGSIVQSNTPSNSLVFDANHTSFTGRQAAFPGRFTIGPIENGYPEIGYNFYTSNSVYTKIANDTAWGIGFGVANRMDFKYAGSGTGTFSWNTFMSITSGGVIRIANFTTNGLVGTDSSGNLGVVNTTYTEIATGTISYSMIAGSAWAINNSFPATIRNYEDDGMAGSAGVATNLNLGRGVTFDLGSAKAVRKIVERGYPTKNLNAIVVQYSTDNSNWTDIHTYRHVYGNTQKDMEFNPTGAISARYWRWFIDSWTEREVQNYYTYESIIYT